jgi:hypothetical protein
VWLKDSEGDSGKKILPDPEDFEDDGIKKAHVEKDFIAFCSSTPGNGFPYRTPLSGLLIEKLTPRC